MALEQLRTASAAPSVPVPSAPQLASGSSLPTALSVGWLLAELEADLTPKGAERLPTGSLMGTSTPGAAACLLAEAPAPEVRVRQIQAKLFLLQADLDRAGVDPREAAKVTAALRRLAGALAPAIDGQSQNGADAADEDESHGAELNLVEAVIRDVLANLTAASARMGRAYGLGFDLANTCQLQANPEQEKQLTDLFGERVVDIHEALADLSSSLPPHAARAVSLSLAQWQYWAAKPTLGKRPVRWPQRAISDALARQGQVWRSVLSGEKVGTEMLAADDYLGALKALARRLVTGRPWVWFILFVLVIVTGVGIFAVVAAKATVVKILGIAVSALGAVGIRTATLKQGFSDVAKEIEAEVWGTELDFAVAQAITVPPGDWRIDLEKINTPPPRGLDPHVASNSGTVHRITSTISERKPKSLRTWRVQKHLHDECEYDPLDALARAKKCRSGWRRRVRVARRFVSNPTLGTHPDEIKPGAPSRLASRHIADGQERSVVWTFHHGRLLHLQEFTEFAEAEAEAERPQPSSRK